MGKTRTTQQKKATRAKLAPIDFEELCWRLERLGRQLDREYATATKAMKPVLEAAIRAQSNLRGNAQNIVNGVAEVYAVEDGMDDGG